MWCVNIVRRLSLVFISLAILLCGCNDERYIQLNPKGDIFGVDFAKAVEYKQLQDRSLALCENSDFRFPPARIFLQAYEPDVFFTIRRQLNDKYIGVSSQTNDVINVELFDSGDRFSSEYAALHVLRDSKIAFNVLELESSECGLMVTDFEGPTKSLRDYFKLSDFNETTVTFVAIEALRMLSVVHSYGFVHGNITLDSYVYQATLEIPANLKLINWQQSGLFVKVGAHVHGETKSRGDDFKALSVVLLTLLLGDPPFDDVDWTKISSPFRTMNSQSTSVQFSERPRYEFLISAFTKHYNWLRRRVIDEYPV